MQYTLKFLKQVVHSLVRRHTAVCTDVPCSQTSSGRLRHGSFFLLNKRGARVYNDVIVETKIISKWWYDDVYRACLAKSEFFSSSMHFWSSRKFSRYRMLSRIKTTHNFISDIMCFAPNRTLLSFERCTV